MTRKHYIQVAANVAAITDPVMRERVADVLATMFKQDNPRFDWMRFLAACGV